MSLRYQSWLIFVIAIPLFVLLGYLAYDNSVDDNHLEITDDFSTMITDGSLDEMNEVPTQQFISQASNSNDLMLLGDRSKIVWYVKTLSPLETDEEQIIEIPFSLLEYINVWFFEEGELVASYRSGSHRPLSERPIKSNSFAFPVHASEKNSDIVIAIKTSTLLNFEVRLWEKKVWQEAIITHKVWQGFILGVVVVLMGYSLLIGISLRNLSYIYYACLVLFVTGLLLLVSGVTTGLSGFKPEHGRAIDFFAFGVTFFGVIFCNHFLAAKNWATKSVHYSYLFLLLSFVITALGYFAVTNRLLTALSPLFVVLGLIYSAYLATKAYMRGIKHARFVLLSFVSMLTGLLIFFAILLELINKGVATHLLEVTSMVSLIVLVFALPDHINLIYNEKIATDKRLIEIQKEFTKVIMTTQEQEREKFSAVLHDGIGHSLLILRDKINRLIKKSRH